MRLSAHLIHLGWIQILAGLLGIALKMRACKWVAYFCLKLCLYVKHSVWFPVYCSVVWSIENSCTYTSFQIIMYLGKEDVDILQCILVSSSLLYMHINNYFLSLLMYLLNLLKKRFCMKLWLRHYVVLNITTHYNIYIYMAVKYGKVLSSFDVITLCVSQQT